MKPVIKRQVRRVLRQLGYEPVPNTGGARLQKIPLGRRTVHFLHLRKNAGTKVAEIIKAVNAQTDAVKMIKHSHYVGLGALPPEDDYFFSIRNPVTRFFSGFYCRKRKGKPRFYAEWTPHEARAFAVFEHANDLAEALYEDSDIGQQAFAAVRSIAHLTANQVDWFSRYGAFLELRPPIWILRQEQFDADLAEFMTRLGVEIDLQEDAGTTRAHSNDYADVPALSQKAIANLTRWYDQDLAFYAHCDRWLDAQKKEDRT